MKMFVGRRAACTSTSCLAILLILAMTLILTPVSLHADPGPSAGGLSDYNFVGAWSGTSSYSVNDVVSYGGSLYINTVATAPSTTTTTAPGGGTNLFDQFSVAQNVVINADTGALYSVGGFYTTGYVNVAGATSFVTNMTINVYQQYGVGFYDANKNFVSGTKLNGNGQFPAGVPVSIPAGASYVRFWWQVGYMGTTTDAAIINTGTTLQSTYTPFGVGGGASTTTTTTPSAAPTDATHWALFTNTPSTPAPVVTTPTASGPWAGKKMFMLSDSIVWEYPAVAGQIASAIGAVPSSFGATAPGIDAFPGRAFDSFTNGQNGATYLPLSASVVADVDLMVIALGTNQDSSLGLGSVTDTPSLNGTMSAQLRAMLETIMGFKPGMRIVVVGPYQTNRYNIQAGTDGLLGVPDPALSPANAGSIAVLKNINGAMKAVCNLYAIPYVDMFNESGVNFSTSTLWLKDGLHPTTPGYGLFYVPYIAAQLARYAQ